MVEDSTHKTTSCLLTLLAYMNIDWAGILVEGVTGLSLKFLYAATYISLSWITHRFYVSDNDHERAPCAHAYPCR